MISLIFIISLIVGNYIEWELIDGTKHCGVITSVVDYNVIVDESGGCK